MLSERVPRWFHASDYVNDAKRNLQYPRCFKDGVHIDKYYKRFTLKLPNKTVQDIYWCKECGAIQLGDFEKEVFPKTIERIVKE